jgi:chitodextrinase
VTKRISVAVLCVLIGVSVSAHAASAPFSDGSYALTAQVGTVDTTPPSVPQNLIATAVSSSRIRLSWKASTDNIGVAGYRIYRGGARIATTASLQYSVTELSPSTVYSFRVAAYDAAGNVSRQSAIATANTFAAPDTIPPTVALTAPLNGATVSGTITITASASDNVGIAGVQFKLDSNNLGTEATTAPYAISWDSRTVANGSHTLTALARDLAGNTTTSSSVVVTVQNQTSGSYSACNAPQLPIQGTRIINVSTEQQLQDAVTRAQPGDTIVIADGTYHLSSTLYLNRKNNVTIRGTSGCDGVVLVGRGMDNANYGNVRMGIWSNSLNTTIAHLTIRDTYDNLIVFNAGAQSPHVYSVKLLNAGSQFIKANPTDPANGIGVDNGVIEYSWLEYTAGPPATDHGAGIGYTNGLSAHAADNWLISDNVFKNFHTPDSARWTWNPAVLMWNHSQNTITENNVFINVDRAIAYGLIDQTTGTDHAGGIIRNNFMYYAPGLMSAARKAGSDGAIIVWDSPNTKIYHNTIMTNGNIVKSIEFRFATSGGEARNNLADAPIGARNGATFTQSGNYLSATPSMFVNPAAANLRLVNNSTTQASVINRAPSLPTVVSDIDGHARPQGAGYDIGADEFVP